MSQRERILDWLKQRGSHGVHSFEMVEAHMPRGAAVIHKLRQDGFKIDAQRETLHGEAQGVRYVLRGWQAPPQQPDAEPSPLFDASVKPLSPYEYEREAA